MDYGAELRRRARGSGWLCIDVLDQDVCAACAPLEAPAPNLTPGRPG